MSSPKSHTNEVIDYWPSWSDWDRSGLKSYFPGGKNDRVDTINMAFAIPQSNGSLKWNDERLDADDPTKKIIQALRAAGKKVLIAIGGASDQGAAIQWNLQGKEIIQRLAESTRKFVDEYGLDGADIDYEVLDKPDERAKVSELIKEFRKRMPGPKYFLTYAAWSIGAYGDLNRGHEHREWRGGNEGIDIKILKSVGDLLDYVFVMSYDAFDPEKVPPYNPIEAIEAYRALMGGRADKVALGIELGPHGWPSGVRTPTEQVKPWMQYAVEKGYRGAGFWTLSFDKPEATGEKAGAFMTLTKAIMPRLGSARLQPEVKASTEALSSSAGSILSNSDSNRSSVAGASNVNQPGTILSTESSATIQQTPKRDTEKGILFQAEGIRGDEKDLIEKLKISDLKGDAQKQILRIYGEGQDKMRALQNQYDALRKQRDKGLSNADPSQRVALRQQFAAHDVQLDDDLKSKSAALQGQLEFYISQMRNEQSRRGGPTVGA